METQLKLEDFEIYNNVKHNNDKYDDYVKKYFMILKKSSESKRYNGRTNDMRWMGCNEKKVRQIIDIMKKNEWKQIEKECKILE